MACRDLIQRLIPLTGIGGGDITLHGIVDTHFLPRKIPNNLHQRSVVDAFEIQFYFSTNVFFVLARDVLHAVRWGVALCRAGFGPALRTAP
jgi:hypothetical protein